MWRPPFWEIAPSPFYPGSSPRLPQVNHPQLPPGIQAFNNTINVPQGYPMAGPVRAPLGTPPLGSPPLGTPPLGTPPLGSPPLIHRSPPPFHRPVIQEQVSPMLQRFPIPGMLTHQMPFFPTPPLMGQLPVRMPYIPCVTSPPPRAAFVPRQLPPAFNVAPWNRGVPSAVGNGTSQQPYIAAANVRGPGPLTTSMRQPTPGGCTPDKFSPVKDRTREPHLQGRPYHYQPPHPQHRAPSPSSPYQRRGFHRDGERRRDQDYRRNYRLRDSSDSRGPRCYSPPPPDVKRVMKYVVPETFYTRQNKDQDAICTLQGTDNLTELHKKFEKEIVLNMASLVDQDDYSDDGLLTVKKENFNDMTPSKIDSLGDTEVDDSASQSNVSDYPGFFGGSDDEGYSDETGSEMGSQALSDSSSESCEVDNDDDDVDEEEEDDGDDAGEKERFYKGSSLEEIRKRKQEDPQRLHPELWFNEKGETNDGPVCRCSATDRRQGIRHGIYPGEKVIPKCDPLQNNANKLHHYWVTVTPHTNFMTENPTVINSKGKDYTFEGFSLFCHQPVEKVPPCSVIRFNIEYFIHFVKEPVPENFCIHDLDLFSQFLFSQVLELSDWDLSGNLPDSCEQFHFMPRFVHRRSDKDDAGKDHELLSMNYVLSHILNSAEPLIKPNHFSLPFDEWEAYVKSCVNSIIIRPDKKPAALRIDNLKFDKEKDTLHDKKVYPYIVHHSIRPVQMSFAGDPQYQKLWKTYIKLRNLISNTPVPSRKHEDKLVQVKVELATMRLTSSMRRDVLVEVSSRGMIKTGLKSDVCQHGLLLPVLVHHLRYHMCLQTLDKKMGYVFKDRSLLQLSLTHPSYHLNFGMNPDHARNSLSNCGVKQPRYGDRKIRHLHTRKKGITQLIRVMSNLGKMEEHQSICAADSETLDEDETRSLTSRDLIGSTKKSRLARIRHNERLEYLGDAVLELICSAHLYFMFPTKPEGGLAMYRSALVQNRNLAQLAKKLGLSDYMQYAHGPDLCVEEDLNHAMANCFEALLGAMFLESGLESATEFFTKLAFEEEDLRNVWNNLPKHPLQSQQPEGDRHLIISSELLQKLVEFEQSSGIEFTHIRLLARAFTHPQVGFNNLTLGSNQRMEFLGDSLLKFVVSEYLFKHFPDHHEGHLTLLRSSLVNHRIQAAITRDLGLERLINFGSKGLKAYRDKLLADVLEAFVAALYVDKGLKHVEAFCRVCLFSRLEDLIINQDWIDAKSQLQQCCLTFREEGETPDLPQYKILQNKGPAHHKRYTVAVYWKGRRMGSGEGKSRRQAEMVAAKDALSCRYFPEMARQKRLLDRKHQGRRRNYWNKEPRKHSEKHTEQDDGGNEPRWEEKELIEERGQKRKLEGEGDEEDPQKEKKRLRKESEVDVSVA